MQHNGDDAQQQSSAFRIWFSVILYHLIKTGGQTFRPPAPFVLADEVLHRINRLGNIAIFPDVDVQLVGNLAIDKAIHGDAEGRDVFQRDALETADAHAVVQVNCEAVFADVADEAVRGMVADIGHAKTLRHAGEHASVQSGNVFHDCTPRDTN